MADPGHNGIAVDKLRAFVERIERLEGEKKALSEDIAEVKREAKDSGFDAKALAFVLSMRKKDKDQRAILQLYAEALGVFA